MTDRKPKKRWQDQIAPEIIAAIGKPRSGERVGQYWLRFKRWESEDSQERFNRAFANRKKGEDPV